ncbi:MAG: hypothetical protein GY838_05705 [bacterium]|nr:hypothetical protein [bacterium]
MMDLCRDLAQGDWYSQLDAVKVTGSNGKGSVCAMLSAILSAAGVENGLYTSPHFFDFRERIAIEGRPIPEGELAAAVAWFQERRRRYAELHPDDDVSGFEASTAVALRFFSERKPATIVAEAGIGGRYDPTRIIPGRLAVLVSLDLEHTELLGSSLEEIAYDKCDLAPDGSVLVVGSLPPEILRRLRAYCRLRGVRIVVAEESCSIRRTAFTRSGMQADLAWGERRLETLEIGLFGEHQVRNAVVALVTVREWLARHRPRLNAAELESAARRGLREIRWPGRFERLQTDPEVFADVGHTPAAVAAVVDSARKLFGGRRILLVTGVSYDKEARTIVHRLVEIADVVICTRACHKGLAAPKIAELIRERRPSVPLLVEEKIERAMTRAVEQAGAEGMTVLVAGGLFVAAEAAAALRGRDPRGLRFF